MLLIEYSALGLGSDDMLFPILLTVFNHGCGWLVGDA